MISVIVPVRNGMPWLEEQLAALSDQECPLPWEIVVADNGSTDRSKELVREWAERLPLLRLVDASCVRGPGATRNVAAGESRGDLLVFCDADDVVHPGWLKAHVSALDDADLSGGVFDYWSLNGLDAPEGGAYAPPPAMGLFGFLPAAGSANLGIKRHVYEELGGFTADLMTGEDLDLSWRAQLAGYRYVTSPDAVIARRDRQGFGAVFRRYTDYGRAGPVLFRRFRSDGLRRDLVVAVKSWVWLIVSAPRLFRPDFRTQWARIAGWRTGCLVESIRQRVLFL